MKISKDDFFMGVCFFVSAQSSDVSQESVVASNNNNIIFSSYSKKDTLGQKFGSSVLEINFDLLKCPFDLYLNFTPSFDELTAIFDHNNKNLERLIYFKTKDFQESSISLLKNNNSCCSIIEYNGNLNWIRDFVSFLNIF